MMNVSIEQVESNLPAIWQKVLAGETLVVTEAGKPFAEIKPLAKERKELRPIGLCEGEFVVPDDFDDPLPESILAGFEGRHPA